MTQRAQPHPSRFSLSFCELLRLLLFPVQHSVFSSSASSEHVVGCHLCAWKRKVFTQFGLTHATREMKTDGSIFEQINGDYASVLGITFHFSSILVTLNSGGYRLMRFSAPAMHSRWVVHIRKTCPMELEIVQLFPFVMHPVESSFGGNFFHFFRHWTAEKRNCLVNFHQAFSVMPSTSYGQSSAGPALKLLFCYFSDMEPPDGCSKSSESITTYLNRTGGATTTSTCLIGQKFFRASQAFHTFWAWTSGSLVLITVYKMHTNLLRLFCSSIPILKSETVCKSLSARSFHTDLFFCLTFVAYLLREPCLVDLR